MNKYIHILDSDGKRITSIVDNMLEPIGESALIKQAKEQYPNATQYIDGGDDMLTQFLSGKIYVNGQFVDPPVIEPTATEIKQAKVTEIKRKYEEKFKTYESALMRARLAGNDTSVAKLQAMYKSGMATMIAEIKGVWVEELRDVVNKSTLV